MNGPGDERTLGGTNLMPGDAGQGQPSGTDAGRAGQGQLSGTDAGRAGRRHLLETALTALLLALAVWRLGVLMRPTHTDMAFSQVKAFHSLPENSVEVIIYGSSRSYRGFSAMELYDRYGIGAYNYSWNLQHLNTTRMFLQDSLLTQSPKLAVIECALADYLLKNTDMTAEIYYTRYLGWKCGKLEFLKQYFGRKPKRWLSYFVPLCAYHDNWKSLTMKSLTGPADESGELLRTMGSSESKAVRETVLPDWTTFRQLEISGEALAELDRIVSLCHERNTEVLFYVTPWKGEFAYGNAMERYAEERGCAFLDLNQAIDEIGLDGKTDFSDESHLNYNGSVKIADYVGRYISEHYQLTDFRKVKGNLWERNPGESDA